MRRAPHTGRAKLVRTGVILLLTATLSACSSGGFGGDMPDEPSTVAKPIKKYVALGDGFVASPDTGKVTDKSCRRSAGNFPALVAETLGTAHPVDVSCVGATTGSLTGPTRTALGTVPAQLDAVDAATDLVTLTVGIGDDDFLRGVLDICATVPCRTGTPGTQVVDQLEEIRTALDGLLRTVRKKAPDAYVIVVGYPQLLPEQGICQALAGMTDTQLAYANVALTTLNDQARETARAVGARFVDVARLTEDHNVCSAEPWVSGPDAAQKDSEPFGPLAPAQAVVAAAVSETARLR